MSKQEMMQYEGGAEEEAGAEEEVVVDEPEFDDWFNDEAAEQEGLENQAAAFRTAEGYQVDPRTARIGDALNDLPVRFAGQCYFKYKDANGKVGIKKGSGHIVKDLGGGKCVMLTAQHIAYSKGEFQNGFFFLQRFGTKGFAAKFEIEGQDDLVHHAKWPNTNVLAGTNITAVRLTLKDGELPAGMPELEELTVSDLNSEVQCTISGYPDKKWVNEKFVKNQFGLYSSNSHKDGEEGDSDKGIGATSESEFNSVCGFSMDTSEGQEGGALVNTKTGQVIGILSGVGPLEGGEFSMATCMNSTVVEWVNDAFA